MKFLSTLVAGLLAASNAAAAPNKAVDACLKGKKVPASYPGNADYDELAEPFNLRLQYKPAAIVLPETNKHVQDAVICASQYGLKVQAKSGGHSYASFSSGGKNGSMSKSLT
jgi:FAD/FMN-containing dehydrogenase